jgi:hypothetical protein
MSRINCMTLIVRSGRRIRQEIIDGLSQSSEEQEHSSESALDAEKKVLVKPHSSRSTNERSR